MEGVNEVTLLGNVGDNAELKSAGATAYATFSLATNETYKDKSGEKKEKVQWHRLKLWGPRAEKLSQYITKGKTLYVKGSIEYSSYEKNGQKLYSTDIRVNDLKFIGGGKRAGDAQEPVDVAQSDASFDLF